MAYCIYLRKSRKDEEMGEDEALKRHEQILLNLSKNQNLEITKIYREIVSGDTISQRPEMQKLLNDVSSKIYKGVLVIEVERLARGNTIDQGIVAETFKFSNTKIITPNKIYNPSNEFDEEYFEFGLFMARREYKLINRRLQRGRLSSVNEGNYIGSIPPFGYDKIKIENNHTLKINETQSKIVELIFNLYTENNMGVSKITNYLNSLNVKPPKNKEWAVSTIQSILKNPVYIGKIRWNSRPTVSIIENGKIKKTRPRSKEHIIVKGLHKPIISEEQFKKAENIMLSFSISPSKKDNKLKNPLAGIVKCGLCGRNMIRRAYTTKQNETLMCSYVSCNNISSPLKIVEEKLFKIIEQYTQDYTLEIEKKATTDSKTNLEILINNFKKNKGKINLQLNKLYDLLEQGVYDTSTFTERSKILNTKNNEINDIIKKLEIEFSSYKSSNIDDTFVEDFQNFNEIYHKEKDITLKNNMLKEIIDYVVYKKDKNCRWYNKIDDFELIIYPKIER